jgi:2-hydroxychromene-2-carboxylate isomerase
VRVRFWVDPACPFCWLTSRWLVRVAPHRDLAVEWLPISLRWKNDPAPDHPFHAALVASHGLLRVMEAVRATAGADRVGPLYTEYGRRLHVHGEAGVEPADALVAAGLDPALAAAAEDEAWDAPIRAAMDAGLALVGDDVGTPIIAVAHPDRPDDEVGLFGPVITELPDLTGSLRLWDGFLAMVATGGFYELKRTRTRAPRRLSESDL